MAEGKPIPDAHVVFENPENGQKYDNKTNSKGEYDRIGFNPGNYNVTITDKDKKVLVADEECPGLVLKRIPTRSTSILPRSRSSRRPVVD